MFLVTVVESIDEKLNTRPQACKAGTKKDRLARKFQIPNKKKFYFGEFNDIIQC